MQYCVQCAIYRCSSLIGLAEPSTEIECRSPIYWATCMSDKVASEESALLLLGIIVQLNSVAVVLPIRLQLNRRPIDQQRRTRPVCLFVMESKLRGSHPADIGHYIRMTSVDVRKTDGPICVVINLQNKPVSTRPGQSARCV